MSITLEKQTENFQNSDLRKIVTEEGGLEPGKEILDNQKCVSRTVELL